MLLRSLHLPSEKIFKCRINIKFYLNATLSMLIPCNPMRVLSKEVVKHIRADIRIYCYSQSD